MTAGPGHEHLQSLHDDVGESGTGTEAAVEAGPDLAARLARLARELQATAETPGRVERAVRAAVDLVPGAEEGSISLVRARRRVSSQAETGRLAHLLDRLQEETGEGPCLDAVFDREVLVVDDLAADDRWPALAARAREVGLRSVLALQLFVEGDNLGALNLCAGRPGAFDEDAAQVGRLLASHVAVAVADSLQMQGTARALATRDVVGQAKGILMERHKVTADQAFVLLTRVSQTTNRRLVDVAEELTASGSLGG
ncbi:GAF and ANTAR domain-containing protein [Pseudokineococcus lusitanus]|uniref:GAF domain-containing protein n=1 Tax=Pseudokineococcus lusitanus TaxID=763993 RepID=A0A3N1GA08_9ACTN|nr:GAF and ANTAR domain-containing protein [Pseudokineococcus lusitanus]ROP27051.1 GAF domain-containing protein [Pseudokineococcus lusitanus]